jgi:hypothetical protein
MNKYVILFSNGLYYHDVQSSQMNADTRFAEIVQNAHQFNNITDAERCASRAVKNNNLTFNLIER